MISLFVVTWIAAGAVAQATQPAFAPVTKLPFLIGADWPADASEAVEKQAADMGINFARINGGGGAWAVESHAKKCKQLEERGVYVLLQLGSHWVPANYFHYTKYYFVDHAGGTGKEDRTSWSIKTGGNDWPQFSYAATGDDFKKELYAEYAKYLVAMKDRRNVMGVILHNEPGLFWQDDKLYDYNPQSIKQFQKWLAGQYLPTVMQAEREQSVPVLSKIPGLNRLPAARNRGVVRWEMTSIEVLNWLWGSEHKTFEDISPPAKMPPITDPTELAAMLDWRRFQTQAIVDWMEWERWEAAKILPQSQWLLTTNMSGPMDNWHFHRCDNMVRIGQLMDALGVDIYPSEWTGKLFGEYTMAMARGATGASRANQTKLDALNTHKPVWVLEAQTYDDSHKSLTAEQRGELLYRDLWTYAAGGAKAVALWRLSDSGGFSLTKGEANPRTAAVKTFAAQAKWLQLERFNPEPASIAVVVDPDSLLYAGATSEKLSKTSGTHHNFQGYYAAVRALRLDADVLFQEQLRDDWALSRYKVLVLPSAWLMDEAMAKRLADFVEAGGVLIVEEGFASLHRVGRSWMDRDGKPLTSPGYGLDKVVGAVPGKDKDGSPVAVKFGKGVGFMLPKNQGQGFLEGWAKQPLAGFAPDLLSKTDACSVLKRSDNALSSANATSTRMRDDRGNTLIVLTQPNEKMKPLAAETGLKVVVPHVPKAPKRVVLLAFDNATGPNIPSAGPLKFTWASNILTIDVPVVTSACAIAFGDALPE